MEGISGESLIARLHHLAISSGSACNSANPDPSHVLLAMGLSREVANNSLRISFGRFTTKAEVEYAMAQLTEQVTYLRKLSPTWELVKDKIINKSKNT